MEKKVNDGSEKQGKNQWSTVGKRKREKEKRKVTRDEIERNPAMVFVLQRRGRETVDIK